jgi:hypothetical protein
MHPPYMSCMLNVVELCTETFNYSYLHLNYCYMLCILCIKLRTFYTSLICNGFCSDHSPKSCLIACYKNNPFFAIITAWKAMCGVKNCYKMVRVFLRVHLAQYRHLLSLWSWIFANYCATRSIEKAMHRYCQRGDNLQSNDPARLCRALAERGILIWLFDGSCRGNVVLPPKCCSSVTYNLFHLRGM